SLLILWRERSRYFPATIAVTFSALLIAMQCGLLLGMLRFGSLPIDHARADIWVMTRGTPSLHHGHPFPQDWEMRVAAEPEVERTEQYLFGASSWHLPGKAASEPCYLAGMRLDDDALGVLQQLDREIRARLTEPGAVVVDESDLTKLGL